MRLYSPNQFYSTLHAYYLLLKAQKTLQHTGLSWLNDLVETPASALTMQGACVSQSASEIDMAYALRWHEYLRLAARLPLWCKTRAPTCLVRSYALTTLLRARGLTPQLRLGVSKRGEQLASHAWVELFGDMVGEPASVAMDFVVVDPAAWW